MPIFCRSGFSNYITIYWGGMGLGHETTGIHGDLANVENWHAVAGDGIFVNKGTAQTYRNLTTSYNLLLVPVHS